MFSKLPYVTVLCLLSSFWFYLTFSTCIPTSKFWIHGGETTTSDEFKFIALIKAWIYIPPTMIETTCTAALITERFIITAAHCLKKDNPVTDLMVYFRAEEFGKFAIRPEKWYIHEEYDFDSYKNDIALVKLESSPIEKVCAQPIMLPSSKELPLPGQKIIVVGHGVEEIGGTNDGLHGTTILKKATMTVTGKPCIAMGPHCLDADAASGSICMGDSGGPAIFENTLIAITSLIRFNNNNSCEDGTGEFTVVFPYTKWINETLNN